MFSDAQNSCVCFRWMRMRLMFILLPLLTISLCGWMIVFGFYLRLEERAWERLVLWRI